MNFGDMLRELLDRQYISVAELSRRTGINKNTLYSYLRRNTQRPDPAHLGTIAEAFGLDVNYFLGSTSNPLPSNVLPISSLHHQRVPLIGEVAAGEPIYAPEDLGVYVDSPVEADAAITVHGDSMEPTYKDGDLVYIKCCPNIPEGAVAVVFLDDEATLKHVYKRPTGLTLWSYNSNYRPMQIEFEDYAVVRVFGVPVGYTRIYKKGIDAKIRKGF